MTLRKLIPILWLAVMYLGTALTAGIDAAPSGGLARAAFEGRHIIMHALAYAAQVWLAAWAVSASDSDVSGAVLILLAMGLAIGAGQEALQTIVREELRLTASLFDLAVDGLGAVIGWWLYHRMKTTRFGHSFRWLTTEKGKTYRDERSA